MPREFTMIKWQTERKIESNGTSATTAIYGMKSNVSVGRSRRSQFWRFADGKTSRWSDRSFTNTFVTLRDGSFSLTYTSISCINPNWISSITFGFRTYWFGVIESILSFKLFFWFLFDRMEWGFSTEIFNFNLIHSSPIGSVHFLLENKKCLRNFFIPCNPLFLDVLHSNLSIQTLQNSYLSKNLFDWTRFHFHSPPIAPRISDSLMRCWVVINSSVHIHQAKRSTCWIILR